MNHLATESAYCQKLELKSSVGSLHGALCLMTLSLTELKEQINYFLHPKELAYFQTLSVERRQKNYLLGRFAAKQAIIHYAPGVNLNDIFIEYGVFQHPIVHYPGKTNVCVSYSHSEQCSVAIAFPEYYPMGIDLEAFDAEKKEIIATQLSQEEKTLIGTLANTSTTYILFWTIKEALSKVLRTGLTAPFDIYAIKHIHVKDNGWVSEFKNFAQYQTLSFSLDKFICSIVYPKQVEMVIDIAAIQQWNMSS